MASTVDLFGFAAALVRDVAQPTAELTPAVRAHIHQFDSVPHSPFLDVLLE